MQRSFGVHGVVAPADWLALKSVGQTGCVVCAGNILKMVVGPSGGQVAAHKSLWAHQWILIRVRDKAEVPAVGRVVKVE